MNVVTVTAVSWLSNWQASVRSVCSVWMLFESLLCAGYDHIFGMVKWSYMYKCSVIDSGVSGPSSQYMLVTGNMDLS